VTLLTDEQTDTQQIDHRSRVAKISAK